MDALNLSSCLETHLLPNILSIMPHSTATKPMLPGALIADGCFLPDAPEQVPDSTKEEDKIDDDSHAQESTRKVPGSEVKLDDLFDDLVDDEDDGLLDSRGSNSNDGSSPPEAPL